MNVAAIYIANAMGAFLLVCVAAGNSFIIKEQAKRNRYLVILAIITICSCVLDSISAFSDSRPGRFWHFSVHASNTILYTIGLVTAVVWILLVAEYMKVKISKLRKTVITVFSVVVIGLIIANMFTPLLFSVDANNVYKRTGGLYTIYAVSYFGFLLDVVVMYIVKRRESGGIKFFPIWAYLVPIVTGMVIQNVFYGVSTIGPFMAISITTMLITFQNNLLFRDQLTDLYNRYYLSMLEKKFSQKPGREYTVVMLDINDFKTVNDVFGHKAGDEALVHLSRALVSIVDQSGEVIRYAGDEFVIILNAKDDVFTESLISQIHTTLKDMNQTLQLPYELTVAAGWYRFRFGEKTLNEFITEADKRMYVNKQEYYKSHPKPVFDAE